MPYLLILPLVLMFEVLLLLVALITCFPKKSRWFSGYMLGIFFGSTIGVVLANEILFHSSAAPVYRAKTYSVLEMNQAIADGLSSTFNLLQWPYVASGGGLLIGSMLGFFFVYRKRKNVLVDRLRREGRVGSNG